MIATISDLLLAIIKKEKEVIERQPDLNHMPMLGAMYEGLARHVVNHAVFDGLDLRVAEGKVRFRDGKLSGQMDCIVAEGDGERLPFTDHYIYDIDKVVAVIEVKKTLYGTVLEDSFLHLRDVQDREYSLNQRVVPLIKSAWHVSMERAFPVTGEKLSDADDIIRHVLIHNAHQPARFVLGYDGYVSEFTLRQGIYDFMSKQLAAPTRPLPGFGPSSFPNQIICGAASLVRLDGMPYGQPVSKSGFWPCLASTSGNPFQIFLEILWTRLTYLYDISAEIFGDDLESEVFNKFLDAKWHQDKLGWEYRVHELTKAELESAPHTFEWEPAYLNSSEFVVMNRLCQGEEEEIDDPGLIDFLKSHGTTPVALVESLAAKRLAGLSGNKIVLLTQNSVCAVLPGGKFVAAENNTGRFSRWLDKQKWDKATG